MNTRVKEERPKNVSNKNTTLKITLTGPMKEARKRAADTYTSTDPKNHNFYKGLIHSKG